MIDIWFLYMDPAHGVPMKIWLYPLPGGEVLYRSLSDSAGGKTMETLEQFEALAGRLRVLRKRKAVQALPSMTTAVKQLQSYFTDFLSNFKSEVKNLHSEIKCRRREESALMDVLLKLRQLSFAPEIISHWIQGIGYRAGKKKPTYSRWLASIPHQAKRIKRNAELP